MRTHTVRRLAISVVAVAALTASGAPAEGQASPPGNGTWTVLDGTCDGQPAQVLDPAGGSTGFFVGGSVGIGKIFTLIDDSTGRVIHHYVEGNGINPQRLVECVFVLPDYPLEGVGVIDLRYVVQVLMTPQSGRS